MQKQLDGTVGRAFLRLCEEVGTPFALEAKNLFEKSDWVGLTAVKVAIENYSHASTLFGDLQVAAFLKKYPDFDLGIDLERKAIEAFWSAERQCFRSNERLSPLLFDLGHYGERMAGLLRLWRKETKKLLGRAPCMTSLSCKFGPGSTFLNVGDDITVAHKLSENYSLTKRASFVLSDWDLTAWSRSAASGLVGSFDSCEATPKDTVHSSCGKELFLLDADHSARIPEFVRGNRFTTVAKDATKLRGICIEPSINVFYQLGVGGLIANRLRRWGWDKEGAQVFHQDLARIGSLTGAIATIDLSSASDTVCTNLVKLVLPPEWYRLVDGLRSVKTRIDGKWVRLEKFSSMGNGFTFELETLLFWGLARALHQIVGQTEDPYTPGVTISVFGDDIVIPTSLSSDYLAALEFFGFTANPDKTFTKGRFRESCGGDYFAGVDVRPHYVKCNPHEPHELIALANGIRRFDLRMRLSGGGDFGRRIWFGVLDSIPRAIRQCRGPESLGDLVIHDEDDKWRFLETTRTRSCIRYLRVWRPVPNRMIGWENFRPGVVLAAALYGVPDGAPPVSLTDPLEKWRRSGIIPRVNGRYVSGYRFGRVAYS